MEAVNVPAKRGTSMLIGYGTNGKGSGNRISSVAAITANAIRIAVIARCVSTYLTFFTCRLLLAELIALGSSNIDVGHTTEY